MEKTDKLKNHLRSNIHFYAIIAILVLLWWVEYWKGQKAHRGLKKHYEEQIQQKEQQIDQNKDLIDSLNIAILSKEVIADSLKNLRQKEKIIYVQIETKYRDEIKRIDTANINSLRELLAGQLESY